MLFRSKTLTESDVFTTNCFLLTGNLTQDTLFCQLLRLQLVSPADVTSKASFVFQTFVALRRIKFNLSLLSLQLQMFCNHYEIYLNKEHAAACNEQLLAQNVGAIVEILQSIKPELPIAELTAALACEFADAEIVNIWQSYQGTEQAEMRALLLMNKLTPIAQLKKQPEQLLLQHASHLFDNAHDVVLLVRVLLSVEDKALTEVVDVQGNAENIFGRKLDLIIGQSINQLMPENEREHHDAVLTDFLQREGGSAGTGRIFKNIRGINAIKHTEEGDSLTPVELNIVPIHKEGDEALVMAHFRCCVALQQQFTESHDDLMNDVIRFLAHILRNLSQRIVANAGELSNLMTPTSEGDISARAVIGPVTTDGAGVNFPKPRRSRLSLPISPSDSDEMPRRDSVSAIVASLDSIANKMQTVMNYVDDKEALRSKQPLFLQSFKMHGLLRDLQGEVSEQFQQKGLELITECNLAENVSLHADVIRICHVLQHLLEQACANSKQHGVVKLLVVVEGELHNAVLHIRVTDNGNIIAADKIPNLYKPIVNMAGAVGLDSFGIGLAHCKVIAERMQGSVKLVENIDTTVTFHFSAPIELEPVLQLTSKIGAGGSLSELDVVPLPLVTQAQNILFVEDDLTILRQYRMAFSGIRTKLDKAFNADGYILDETKEANYYYTTNGEMALKLVVTLGPCYFDKIVTDNSMPKMTGLEFGAEVRKLEVSHNCRYAICFVTGDATYEIRQQVMTELGVDTGFHTKPVKKFKDVLRQMQPTALTTPATVPVVPIKEAFGTTDGDGYVILQQPAQLYGYRADAALFVQKKPESKSAPMHGVVPQKAPKKPAKSKTCSIM